MANSASLQLFELISSMSRSEKRYFKIYIRTHASKHEKDYVELFQLVEQQDMYDEQTVIKKIQSSGPTQRFAVLKHRLFEKILDALESYQRSSDEGLRLRHEINRAQVLLQRGMHRVGFSILQKVEQQAMRIEAYETALEAWSLLASNVDLKEKEFKYSAENAEQILHFISIEHDLIEIKSQVQSQIRQQGRMNGIAKDLAVLKERVKEIMANPQLPARSGYHAHHVLALLEFAENNIAKSLAHLKNCQEKLSANLYLLNDMPMAKADLWANETYCHLMLHDEESARQSLLLLLDIVDEDLDVHHHLEHRGNVLQSLLFYLNKTGDQGLEDQLQSHIEKYQSSRWDHPPLIRAGIDYGLGLYYHNCGDSGKALRSLNRVLNDGEVRRDEDVYHRTLVLITLLHAESGDRSWMVHSARSLKRYLVPRGLLQGADALLLDYIADFRRSRSEEGEHRAILRFAEGLRSIRKNAKDKVAFEHFDFLAWAEDHLKDILQTNKVA